MFRAFQWPLSPPIGNPGWGSELALYVARLLGGREWPKDRSKTGEGLLGWWCPTPALSQLRSWKGTGEPRGYGKELFLETPSLHSTFPGLLTIALNAQI